MGGRPHKDLAGIPALHCFSTGRLVGRLHSIRDFEAKDPSLLGSTGLFFLSFSLRSLWKNVCIFLPFLCPARRLPIILSFSRSLEVIPLKTVSFFQGLRSLLPYSGIGAIGMADVLLVSHAGAAGSPRILARPKTALVRPPIFFSSFLFEKGSRRIRNYAFCVAPFWRDTRSAPLEVRDRFVLYAFSRVPEAKFSS